MAKSNVTTARRQPAQRSNTTSEKTGSEASDVADMLGTPTPTPNPDDQPEKVSDESAPAAECSPVETRPHLTLHGPCPEAGCNGKLGSSGTMKIQGEGGRPIRIRYLICRMCSTNVGKEVLS